MKQYRVIKRDGYFFPQVKGWIFWHDYVSYGDNDWCNIPYFDNFVDANNYVVSLINENKSKRKTEIIKVY